MIKQVECIKFLYECLGHKNEITLESELQFTALTPKDETLLERAILVQFRAHGDEEKYKLECQCRVVFSFEKAEAMVEGKELLHSYQSEAYAAFQKLVNSILVDMNQPEMNFPKIDFT